MTPAYQKVSRHVLMWVALGFAGIAAQLGVLYAIHELTQESIFKGRGLALSFLPLLGILILGVRRMVVFDRMRLKRLGENLKSSGFQVSVKPKPETKASFWQSLEALAAGFGMSRGAEAIQWLSLRGEEGERMAAWEYQFVTSSGKVAQIHEFTALAWPQGYPGLPQELVCQPSVQIRRLPWLERRVRRSQEIAMPGMETFGEEWSVYGDATTAARVLSPACLSLLGRSPKGECWHVGDGWVCVCFLGKLDAANFAIFFDHAEELRRRLR